MDKKYLKLGSVSPVVKEFVKREKLARLKEQEIDSKNKEIQKKKVKLNLQTSKIESKIESKDDILEKREIKEVLPGPGRLIIPGRYLRKKVSGLIDKVKMTFSLDRETKEILKSVSMASGISMSEIISRSIWCYLTVRSQYR